MPHTLTPHDTPPLCLALCTAILEARGPKAVRKELLVGFDPLPIYVALLEQRFSDLAVFCADFVGGDLVGVKWRPAAVAQLPRQQRRQQQQPVAEEQQAGKSRKGSKKQGGAGLGNGTANGMSTAHDQPADDAAHPLVGVLADMVHLGAGLVEWVELVSPLT